jgi:hypothetical protein
LFAIWKSRFGPVGELLAFVVCDAIDTPLEIGGDTFCIDGQWPETMLHGLEKKDAGYFAAVTKRNEMPESVRDVLDGFTHVLKDYRYRNFWSMEIRVKDEDAFFTDATCRMGLPSGASQMELWSNLGDIILEGAHGRLVEPEPLGKFSAEAVLTSKTEKGSWIVIEVPDDLLQWMKLSHCCQVDDRICFSPNRPAQDEIGWLVAIGDTPKQTIERLKEYAAALPSGVSANVASLADVLHEINQEEDAGIKFSRQPIPELSSVLDNA